MDIETLEGLVEALVEILEENDYDNGSPKLIAGARRLSSSALRVLGSHDKATVVYAHLAQGSASPALSILRSIQASQAA